MAIFINLLAVILIAFILYDCVKKIGNREIQFDRYAYFVLIIILLGIVVRVIQFGIVPGGLMPDEPSIAYETRSLMDYGMDRNGYSNPVYFVSWGGGQNVAYAYLSMFFVKILGYSMATIRCTQLFYALLTFVVLYNLTKELFGRKTALISIVLLAILPWHIMLSRWALESDLLPFFLTTGIYFLVLAKKKSLWLYPAAISLGLALYSYALAYLLVPLLLIVLLCLGFFKGIKLKQFILPCGLLFVIAFPLILFVAVNQGWMEEIRTSFISIPRLPNYRASEVGATGIFENVQLLLRLLIKQDDTFLWNAISGVGTVYYFSLPLLILGLIRSIKNFRKENIPFILFLLVIIMGCVTPMSITRLNSIYIPMIILIAYGIEWLSNRKIVIEIICVTYLLLFCNFTQEYFTRYKNEMNELFYYHLEEALDYANSLDGDSIYLTDYVTPGYIYVLFYEDIPVTEFIESVNYTSQNAKIRMVDQFGKYRFTVPDRLNEDEVAIINMYQSWPEGSYELVGEFGYFSVLLGTPEK